MIQIRNIEPGDNPALARIVRDTLKEFGANHLGTVYYEDSTDHLFEMFQTPRSVYFVAEEDGLMLGGAGLYPTIGLPEDMVELVKMYLIPEARGKGLGSTLIAKCLENAKNLGFKRVYLESMPELSRAVQMYERLGFKHLTGPLGQTGHFGCGIWMEKAI